VAISPDRKTFHFTLTRAGRPGAGRLGVAAIIPTLTGTGSYRFVAPEISRSRSHRFRLFGFFKGLVGEFSGEGEAYYEKSRPPLGNGGLGSSIHAQAGRWLNQS
jgi:hypothetical protein